MLKIWVNYIGYIDIVTFTCRHTEDAYIRINNNKNSNNDNKNDDDIITIFIIIINIIIIISTCNF